MVCYGSYTPPTSKRKDPRIVANRHERRKQMKHAKGSVATASMSTEWIGRAVTLMRAGQAGQAERLCREVLRADRRQPAALHLLGVIALQRDDVDGALGPLGQAVAAAPDFADAHATLGTALARLGRHAEAVEAFRRALHLRPDQLPILVNLGIALSVLGRFDEAETAHRRVVELDPNFVEGHNNLALVLRERGRLEEAEAAFRRALALRPNQPAVWTNLGTLLCDRERFDEAVDAHRRAIALAPNNADARHNLGLALRAKGDIPGAARSYREAIALDPRMAAVPLNLGTKFDNDHEAEAVIAALEQAIGAAPTNADLFSNLGTILRHRDRLDEGIAHLRHAIALDPSDANTWNRLGGALLQSGETEEAQASFRRGTELAPDDVYIFSNWLLSLQYRPGITAAELDREHRLWDQRFAITPTPHYANRRDPARPLRVGFVSADFGRHPVGFFLLRLLENHDREAFRAIAYSDRFPDPVTEQLKAAADEWHDIRGETDDALVERIRSDDIDILFDMAGHSGQNRLRCFARKPAPIQITWAGYVGTTGLAAMDYVMADRFHVSPDGNAHYGERILRLPNDYICYAPPGDAPDVAPLPAAANGFITFGCFNNPAKINDPLLDTWGEIMKRVPESRLFLKYNGMADTVTRQRVGDRLAEHGIDAARLIFESRSPHAQLLAAYGRVDIGLDTFPYSGGLTTCEALWMGVPVVTVTGATFAGRHSTSHLSNVGLTETIATDVDGYIATAAALAGNLDRLAGLRATLRERMAASPLCDGPRFASDFETALRGAWQAWCAESGG